MLFSLFIRNQSDQNHSLGFYLSVYGGLAGINSIFALFRAFLFAMAGIKAAVVLHDKLLSNIVKVIDIIETTLIYIYSYIFLFFII